MTACENEIIIWKKNEQLYLLNEHKDKVTQLFIFGDALISTSIDHTMKIWNYKSGKLIKSIDLHPEFEVTDIIHPNTYLNKIVISSSTGRIQLWNINSYKLIYEFKGFPNNCICSLCQTPALDIIAVGLENGKIIFLNLKTDEEIITYKQSSAVTAISFRSDDSKFPFMATGGNNGEITIWDLKV